MVNYYPDFFNDVFGPVMQPGSSSHTAGPCRIGRLANDLVKGKLKKISVHLDKNGSFAGTFGLMSEDLGMLSGAYGLLPDDERMFDIKDILAAEKIGWEFVYEDFSAGSHPNAVKFVLTDENGTETYLLGNSTGGGMVETVDVNGVKYPFVGDSYLYCLAERPENGDFETVKNAAGEEFYIVKTDEEQKGLDLVFRLRPVLPVHSPSARKEQLFDSFTAWRDFAEKNSLTLAEAAVEYEKRASGLTAEEIVKRMETLKSYMRAQTQNAYEDDSAVLENPYTGFHFRDWRKYEQSPTLAGGVSALATHYAFGVQAQARGVRLVPGPMGTGGGYLYAALRAVKETYGFSDEKETEALLVAAAVGAVAYTRTNPTGEMTGCTGECGVCGAMAAAAITYLACGTPVQVENAASLMLQAAVGWPCDPIPGGLNQPCISRVLTAVNMSIVFSDLALSGKEALLPFHEVLDVMDRMGKEMPASLKCMSCGGTCTAPTAAKCKAEYEKWYAEK